MAGGTGQEEIQFQRGAVQRTDKARPYGLELLEPRLLLSGLPFVTDPANDQRVVIEAESYHAITPGVAHTWSLDGAFPGAVGGGAMVAGPDSGFRYNDDFVANAPRLDFNIDFAAAGTYYVWTRGATPDSDGNSVHLGLNGAAQPDSDRHDYPSGLATPAWSNTSMDGPVITLNVPTAGEHTVNLWMREDGVTVDRLLLTQDPGYTPSGGGPAESPRRASTGEVSGTVWEDLNGDGVRDPGEPGLAGVTVYLDDNGDGVLNWADADGDNAWDAGEGERWLLSAVDDPVTTGADEAGQYVFDGLAEGDYVVREVVTENFTLTHPPADPIELGKLAGSLVCGAERGTAIAIDGDYAVVGAPQAGAGTAFVFRWDGGAWVQEAQLTASDPGLGDDFGWSVDISGDTVIVGAYANDDAGSSSGSAYVFTRTGTTWTQQAKLTASDAITSDFFGYSVALDGNTALVGAYGNDDRGSLTGSAYIFERIGTVWTERTKLTADDGNSSDYFGISVGLDGDTAIIGASLDDDRGASSGSAYIFQNNGPGWVQADKLTASDGGSNDRFGRDVAISGDQVLIGAYFEDPGSTDAGSAYVFRWDGIDWIEDGKLSASDGTSSDLFGFRVALDGDTALVGAYLDDPSGTSSGSAYVFRRLGGSWTELDKLTAFDGGFDDQFGYDVALQGDRALIGAPREDAGAVNTGSVYAYRGLDQGAIYLTLGVDEVVTGQDFGNQRLPAPTPGGPDLEIASDTGNADDDNITRWNNADAGTALSFTIADTVAGATVRLFADNGGTPILLGQAVAAGTSTTVTTDGVTVLADGDWNFTATQERSDFLPGPSPASAGLTVTIDTAAPVITVDPLVTDSLSPALTGTVSGGDAGTEVRVQVAGEDTGFVPNGASPTWQVAEGVIGPLTPGGNYAVLASVRDAAGNLAFDATDFELQVVPTSGLIIGRVGIDLNGDGFADPAEPGLAGVTVYLDQDDDGVLDWTDGNGNNAWDPGEGERWFASFDDNPATPGTDEVGVYGFAGLMSGDYTIRQVPPTGFVQRTPEPGPVEIDKLVIDDGLSGAQLGYSLAVDGDYAVVGAPQAGTGTAYVFHWNGFNWVRQAQLNADDAGSGDDFGWSVDISGDTVIVGAYANDDAGSSSGSAYVFTRSGDAWTQQAKLTASDAVFNDLFGYAVALDGDTALIGAHGDDDNGSFSGSAYLFERVGTAWSEAVKLTAGDGASNDYFGISVSLDGGTALIGAYLDDDFGSDSGSAYLFEDTGSGWVQLDKLVAADGSGSDRFGWDVAISGDTAVVGAYLDDDRGGNSGSAYVFRRSGSAWVEDGKLTASDGASNDNFGYRVAADGDTVAVSANLDDDRGSSSGSAYIYERSGSGWEERSKLTASDGSSGDQFGTDVALDGGNAFVGAAFEDTPPINTGSAYVFRGLAGDAIRVSLAPAETRMGVDFTVARSLDAPDLDAASDTGVSATDDLTNRNNADAASALTFHVGEALAGDTVELFADDGVNTPILLATVNVAADGPLSITTDGSTVLPDGAYNITTRLTDALGVWDATDALGITVDTTAPTITVDDLSTVDTTPSITGTLSEPLASLRVGVGDPTGFVNASLNNTAGTWSVSNNALGPLPDGPVPLGFEATDQAGNVTTGTDSDSINIVPTPDFAVADVSVAEGDDGVTLLTFDVTPSAPAVDALQLLWSISPGTATEGEDYVLVTANNPLEWAVGESATRQITVEVLGDRVIEIDETLQLNLLFAVGAATISDPLAVGTIINDDVETFSSVIAGTVWEDQNGDGVRDPGEPGLAGVTVFLDSDGDALLDWSDGNGDNAWDPGEGERWVASADDDPATTDVDETGAYRFDGLPSGTYTVVEIEPLDFIQTAPFGAGLLLEDDFPTTTIDTSQWALASGVVINTTGNGEPSAPYALELSGPERLESNSFDLSAASGSTLRYWWQQRGLGDEPESGDDLFAEYRRADGVWIELERQLGSTASGAPFAESVLTLPADALHATSAIRFRSVGASGADDWFVDDVRWTADLSQGPVVDLGADEAVLDLDFGNQRLPDAEVAGSDPADDALVNSTRTEATLDFALAIDDTTLEAGDLLVDGTPATGFTLVDADTVTFTFPELTDGVHTLSLAGGAVLDFKGRPVAAFNAEFTIDTVGPRVIASNIVEGAVLDLAADTITWSVQFDEPITETGGKLRAQLTTLNQGSPVPFIRVTVDANSYDPATRTATFTFETPAPENAYRLSLSSFDIRDLAGNMLDGEATWPLPAAGSGDGTPGGDFFVNISVDRVTPEVTDRFFRAAPLGSLISRTPEAFGELGTVGAPGVPADTDTFTVARAAGQTVSAILTPIFNDFADPATYATMTLSGLGGGLTALAPGEPVVLNFASSTVDDVVSFTVSSDLATYYAIEFVLNAFVEDPDSTAGTPLPIDGSAVTVGSGTRWAVRGTLTQADGDALDADLDFSPNPGSSGSSFGAAGQSFLAPTAAIDTIQFSLYTFGTAEVTARLREALTPGQMDGPIVAESGPITVRPVETSQDVSWTDFDFGGVSVNAGSTYFVELVPTATSSTVYTRFASVSYPDGEGFRSNSTNSADLAFRIGTPQTPPGDAYTVDLTGHVGASIDVVYERRGPAAVTAGPLPEPGGPFPETLELIAPDGTTVLATATADPLGTPTQNVDLSILGLTVPTDGVYTLRIGGEVTGDYTLTVTESLGFSVEPNGTADPLRELDDGGAVLGYVSSGDDAIYALYSTFNQSPNQIVEIDPATGGILRTVVEFAGGFYTNLAYDGQRLYALNIRGSGGFGGVSRGIEVYDPSDGALLEVFPTTVPGDSISPRGLSVLGDELVIGNGFNSELFFFDKNTGDWNRTIDSDWPSESPSDVLGVSDRGSVFFGQSRAVTEVDAATGAVLNTILLESEINGFVSGLAWLQGRLLVSTQGGDVNELLALDPDTGGVVDRQTVAGVGYIDLGGAGAESGPWAPPVIGDPVLPGGDAYTVTLLAGETVTFATQTPFDGASALPGNTLDPALVLYGPDGTVIAFDEDTAGAPNATLTHVAAAPGVYTVQVLPENSFGEYLLTADVTRIPLAGDFNGDGGVDQGDLDLVLLNWGATLDAVNRPANWWRDLPVGPVGQAELDAVLLNWGSTL